MLHGRKKEEEWENTAGPILAFKGICDYLGWSVAGIITAGGCKVRADIEKTDFGRKAYELEKNRDVRYGRNHIRFCKMKCKKV